MKSENLIQDEIRIEAKHHAMTLFRNNIGSGWMGQVARNFGGEILLSAARRVAFGVGGKGGSDLIGWRSIIVTQDMVGKPFAQFTAIEVKNRRGKLSAVQKHFLSIVRDAGGIGLMARSADDLP